jgi:hypothetical protein
LSKINAALKISQVPLLLLLLLLLLVNLLLR